MILVVLRGTVGSVSVRSGSGELTFMTPVGRASEVTVRHRQVKPTSQCMSFKNMVLKVNRINILKGNNMILQTTYIAHGTLARRRECCWRVIPVRYDNSI